MMHGYGTSCTALMCCHLTVNVRCCLEESSCVVVMSESGNRKAISTSRDASTKPAEKLLRQRKRSFSHTTANSSEADEDVLQLVPRVHCYPARGICSANRQRPASGGPLSHWLRTPNL